MHAILNTQRPPHSMPTCKRVQTVHPAHAALRSPVHMLPPSAAVEHGSAEPNPTLGLRSPRGTTGAFSRPRMHQQ